MRLLTFRITGSVRIERRSHEEKKRDPRFLEEEEGATASRGAGRDEGPAAATARATGQIGKAAGNFDEIGAQRIIVGADQSPPLYSASRLILASARSVRRWSVSPSSSRVC